MKPPSKDGPVTMLVLFVCIFWVLACLAVWGIFRRPDPVPLDEILESAPSNMALPDFNRLQRDAATPAEQAIIDETLKEWHRMTNR